VRRGRERVWGIEEEIEKLGENVKKKREREV